MLRLGLYSAPFGTLGCTAGPFAGMARALAEPTGAINALPWKLGPEDSRRVRTSGWIDNGALPDSAGALAALPGDLGPRYFAANVRIRVTRL
jgi:hypothetical protein